MLKEKYVVNLNICLSLQQNVLLFECLGKIHNKNVRILQAIQKFACQIISSAKKYDNVTPLLKSLSRLHVKDQLYYRQAIMAFKCLTGQASKYLTSQFNTHYSKLAKEQLGVAKS